MRPLLLSMQAYITCQLVLRTSMAQAASTTITDKHTTLYVYFGSGAKKQTIKIDDEEISDNPVTKVIEAGTHKLIKADSSQIALTKFVPAE